MAEVKASSKNRKSLTVIPLPQKITHRHPPASENHLQSCPCLRKSNTLIPLPQKIKHTHPTASENHSQSSTCLKHSHSHIPLPHSYSASSPCVRKSLTVFPLPQKITHCGRRISAVIMRSWPLLWFKTVFVIMSMPLIYVHHPWLLPNRQ